MRDKTQITSFESIPTAALFKNMYVPSFEITMSMGTLMGRSKTSRFKISKSVFKSILLNHCTHRRQNFKLHKRLIGK